MEIRSFKKLSTLNSQLSTSSGQTLIEVLVALAVAALIISAISIAVLSSLNNSIFSKNQNMATQYAQEGLEIMRRIKESRWTEFSSYTAGNYCLAQGSTSLTARDELRCPQNIGIFVREVGIETSSTKCSGSGSTAAPGTKINVGIYWSDGKCRNAQDPYCNKAEVVSCFTNADVIPEP